MQQRGPSNSTGERFEGSPFRSEDSAVGGNASLEGAAVKIRPISTESLRLAVFMT